MTEAGYIPDRTQLYGHGEMSRLLAPSSIAVVGASETPGSFGLRTMENLCAGFSGPIYPIHPTRQAILGRPCHASLRDLPEVPDCVILSISREAVLPLVEECAVLGVGGAIVYASGFAEAGSAERIALQRRLAEIARDSGMRILGPNCVGVANFHSRAAMHFMPRFSDMPYIEGRIGLVSQSGGLGYTIIQALERGIGFSYFLSAGNSCDVDVCDLMNYLVDDPDTDVIACIMEGVRDGGRLLAAGLRALEAGKPMLVYKMGSSEISQATALSHTGTLAGADAAYRAAFDRAGIVLLDNWEELLETAGFFLKAGVPTAPGVGVMASSGGAAVMAADKAEENGVALPPPAAPTVARLKALVPDYGSVANPTDMTAETLKSFDLYGNCITAFAEDPAYGAVVVPMMSAQAPVTVDRARYLAQLAAGLKKPLCLVWINEWLQGPGSEVYDGDERISMFRSMSRCMKAIARWQAYHEGRARRLEPRAPRQSDAEQARKASTMLATASGRTFSESQSKDILGLYGIPAARQKLVRTKAEALAAAGELGFPLALKADSPDIPHKTEAGVVRLDIADKDALGVAFAEIEAAVARLPGTVKINGMLMQQMIRGRVEMMIGGRVDRQFGPLVSCGFGGIGVEVIADMCTRLAPVGMREAREMIRQLRGHRLLAGYRNVPPLDVEALARMICAASEFIADQASIVEELDINPILLNPQGGTAVDALIVRKDSQ